jgi:hypothetical protein
LGHITNNHVSKRLAPGVLNELRARLAAMKRAASSESCFRVSRLVMDPKLRELLAGETMLAKYSPTPQVFKKRVDREYPPFGETIYLPFPERSELPESEDRK